MNGLSTKTYCVVTRGIGKFWVTADQAERIKTILIKGNDQIIEIDGNFIRINVIAGVVTGAQITELDHEKKGDWKCKYGYWHIRGQQCAHDQLRNRPIGDEPS